MRTRFVLVAAAVLALYAGCEKGLQPGDSVIYRVTPPPGDSIGVIAGTVSFTGTRPSADSLRDLRVVAFTRKYPTDSIVFALFTGAAYYTATTLPDSLPAATYAITVPRRTYAYIAVAQQFGPSLYTDWRAVGVYAPTGDATQPGAVTVRGGDTVHADIAVDWDHLPPQ